LGGVSAPVKTRAGYAVVKAVEQIPAVCRRSRDMKARVIEAIKR